MSYDGQIVRIEKLTNGYEVEVCDPEVKKRNSKRDSVKGGPYAPYKDPWKSYAFKTAKEVTDFLAKTLDKLTPDEDEFSTTFDKACSDMTD